MIESMINDVSAIENNDVDDEMISLLDPLGENNVVKDVEIQEIWES